MTTNEQLTSDERAVLECLTTGRSSYMYIKSKFAFTKEALDAALNGLEQKELLTKETGFTFTAYAITEAGVYALAEATNAGTRALASAQADHAAGDVLPSVLPVVKWDGDARYHTSSPEHLEAVLEIETLTRDLQAANAKIAAAASALKPFAIDWISWSDASENNEDISQRDFINNYEPELFMDSLEAAHKVYKALTDDSA
jgi:hypothetical protein